MKHRLSKRFPQKRAFVTGAASGLGRCICKELAADRWIIGMADMNEKALKCAVEDIATLGGKPQSFGLDVSDKDAYRIVAERFLETTGGIDLLVNNAGVGDGGYVEEYGLDNWDWLLNINLRGVIYGNALFLPVFKRQKSGAIINISSAAAFASLPRMGAYNVSKAGVRALSETMDAELRHLGISVSCVMPTFFKTNVMQQARGNEEEIDASRLFFAATQLTPEKVAKQVLKKAGKGMFHIILPTDAKFMFLLKRLFPSGFQRLLRLGERNKGTFRRLMENRYTKADRKGRVDHEYLDQVFKTKAGLKR